MGNELFDAVKRAFVIEGKIKGGKQIGEGGDEKAG